MRKLKISQGYKGELHAFYSFNNNLRLYLFNGAGILLTEVKEKIIEIRSYSNKGIRLINKRLDKEK